MDQEKARRCNTVLVVEVGVEVPMDEENDGYKTPTSEESKIPPFLECPPAPRRSWITFSSRPRKRRCTEVSRIFDHIDNINNSYGKLNSLFSGINISDDI
ncbi:hypothetical protein SESBI_07443 [Sesbania bispinosa]|nr:hypothetical protein SESBI_07443 [Sesbania bispinosa]